MVFKDWDYAVIGNNRQHNSLHVILTSLYRLPDVLSIFTSGGMCNIVVLQKPKLSIDDSILHIEGLRLSLLFFSDPIEYNTFDSESIDFKPLNVFIKSKWKEKLFRKPVHLEVVEGWVVGEIKGDKRLYERYVSNFDIVLDR